MGHHNAYIFQTAKDARASQDTRIEIKEIVQFAQRCRIFEPIELFLCRLDRYTEVPPSSMRSLRAVLTKGDRRSL